MIGPRIGLLLVAAALAACAPSDRERTLHKLTSVGNSPEEFSIVPVKPLQDPQNFSELPTPNPRGANLVDPTPKADAVAALGGDPRRLNAAGIPSSDAALIDRTARFGVDGNIRATLAEEDEAFRKRRKLFSWKLVPKDEYVRAYQRQRLDARTEWLRFRRLGVRTPAAPPYERPQ